MSQSGIINIAGGGGSGSPILYVNLDTGISPIVPTANAITLTGGAVAAGTNPVRTDGTGVSIGKVEVQVTQALAATDITKVGLSNFNSTQFSVDANGFVSLAGGGGAPIETITGNTGGPESPAAGNFNILGTGSITVAGSANTETVQLTNLTNHAVQVGAGTATLTQLAVGSNGQVLLGATAADPAFGTLTSSDSSISFTTGANSIILQVAGGTTVGKTITGNSGGALSPTAGNWNTLGTGSITIAGAGSTLTTQLTGITNHALQVGAGTATLTQLGSGTTGQILQTNTAADPTWSTATYPSTTTINQILYSSAANTVGGITAANSALLVSSNTGVPAWSGTLTNGQMIIGSTGATPAAGTITSTGGTITVSLGAGTLNLEVASGGFAWTNVTSTSATMVKENAYQANNAGLVTLTMPSVASSTFGDTIKIGGFGAGGWLIQCVATQLIHFGNVATSAAGSIASTNRYDQLEIVCSSTTTEWFVRYAVGNLTIA